MLVTIPKWQEADREASRVIITLSDGSEFTLSENDKFPGQLRVEAYQPQLEIKPQSSASVLLRQYG